MMPAWSSEINMLKILVHLKIITFWTYSSIIFNSKYLSFEQKLDAVRLEDFRLEDI